MKKIEPNPQIEISEQMLRKWQNMVDILAKLINIPAALIMRITKSDIEVFVSSQSDGNPYRPGDSECLFGSGLYCETVINSTKKLLIPNALVDENWDTNPDIKLDMISYLGFPILWPDGTVFGTICVLDSKPNAYSTTYEDLIKNFRDIIQSHIELIYMNSQLNEKNKAFSDYINEIKTLRGLLPICASCKRIRESKGRWTEIEAYIYKNSEVQFSHSICPECSKELYPDEDIYD